MQATEYDIRHWREGRTKLSESKAVARTLVMLAVAALLLVVAVAGCTTKGSAEKDEKPKAEEAAHQEGAEEESKAPQTDISGQKARVEAAAKIDELRKADKPVYAEIERIFNAELKETVQKRDAENQTTMVADIERAIAAAKSGKDVALNGQRISKTLIRAFYLSAKHEFDEAETTFADKSAEGAFHKWDEAEAYFGGLASSGYLKDNAALISRIDEAFENGRNAIAEDKLLEMKLAAQIVDKISIRFFVGSVLREVDAAQGAEASEALEKVVEGQVFYSAVAGKFKDQDKQIRSALATTQAAKPDTLRTLFAQGLADKVASEAGEVAANWGTDKAAVVAIEGTLYMEALIEVVGDNQVGDLGAIQDQLSQLEAAVASDNKEEAATLAEQIIAAVKDVRSKL